MVLPLGSFGFLFLGFKTFLKIFALVFGVGIGSTWFFADDLYNGAIAYKMTRNHNARFAVEQMQMAKSKDDETSVNNFMD